MASHEWERATIEQKLDMVHDDIRAISDAQNRLAAKVVEGEKRWSRRLAALEARLPKT